MTILKDVEYSLFGPAPLVEIGPDVNGNMFVFEIYPVNATSVLALTTVFVLFLIFMWLRHGLMDVESRGQLIDEDDKPASATSSSTCIPQSPITPPPPAYATRPSTPAPDYLPQSQDNVRTQASTGHLAALLSTECRTRCCSSAHPNQDLFSNTTHESSALSEIHSSPSFTSGNLSVRSFCAVRSVSDGSVLRPPTARIPVESKATAWGNVYDIRNVGRDEVPLSMRRGLQRFSLDLKDVAGSEV